MAPRSPDAKTGGSFTFHVNARRGVCLRSRGSRAGPPPHCPGRWSSGPETTNLGGQVRFLVGAPSPQQWTCRCPSEGELPRSTRGAGASWEAIRKVRNSVASGVARKGLRVRPAPLPRREPQADVVTAPRSKRDEAHALGDSTSSGSALEGLSIGELTSWKRGGRLNTGLGVRLAHLPPLRWRCYGSTPVFQTGSPGSTPGHRTQSMAGWQRWSMCAVATREMPVRVGSRPPWFLSSVGESGGLKSLRRSFDATRNHPALVVECVNRR